MFIAVFSIFVIAVVVLCVLTVRFAIRRDRERRAQMAADSTTKPSSAAP